MTSTIDFNELPFDATKYFVSSGLFANGASIDCPNDLVKSFIEHINDPAWITRSLTGLSLSKKIFVFDFMDQYCISRGTIRLFKNSLGEQLTYDPETANTIYYVNIEAKADVIISFDVPIKEATIGTTIKTNGANPTQIIKVDKSNAMYHIFECKTDKGQLTKLTVSHDVLGVPIMIIIEKDAGMFYGNINPRKIKAIFTVPSL